ncbi:MAG: hypothetical protein CVV44_20285 [Spirochaetae bacterium HGW-Spirochaetae-1]|nr:MAG: hypothetical protein CVV44_20285 [Spirochaetae bacterium HGW-Spirochaetae-1]
MTELKKELTRMDEVIGKLKQAEFELRMLAKETGDNYYNEIRRRVKEILIIDDDPESGFESLFESKRRMYKAITK